MSNTYLECGNESPLVKKGAILSFKIFVYIKACDTDLLAVNNLATGSLDANGDIAVDNIEVLNARKIAGDEEEYISNFEWSDLPAVKTAIAQYLNQV